MRSVFRKDELQKESISLPNFCPSYFMKLESTMYLSKHVQANQTSFMAVCSQVRDRMAAAGMEPLEEEIPSEDVLGRNHCRYNVRRLSVP